MDYQTATWSYALRHYSLHPTLPRVFATYTEQTTGRPTNINGKIATTIFLNTKPARDRAVKEGWVDESDLIRNYFEKQNDKDNDKKTKKRGRPKKV